MSDSIKNRRGSSDQSTPLPPSCSSPVSFKEQCSYVERNVHKLAPRSLNLTEPITNNLYPQWCSRERTRWSDINDDDNDEIY